MEYLITFLLERVRRVRASLHLETTSDENPQQRFADLLDSMAMVEFLLHVAEDCGRTPEEIEACVNRRFGTVGELAAAMQQAAILPTTSCESKPAASIASAVERTTHILGIAALACEFGAVIRPAESLDERLGRRSGWLTEHAGLRQRREWGARDPISAAVDAAQRCLQHAGLKVEEIGALLVTSETPPLLAGLGAALHHRLGLANDAVSLEIGNACNGFLTALWVARRLALSRPNGLIVAIEVPTRYLQVGPGSAGENAALFGDAAAVCLFRQDAGGWSTAVVDVVVGTDGSGGNLIDVAAGAHGIDLEMQGPRLALRAVDAMAGAVQSLTHQHGVAAADLRAVVMHAGNGRFPAMLAHRLDLPPERILSQTAMTGNLGSASVPAAWCMREEVAQGPVIWTSVGAGLTWGAALIQHR
jgi:3-oxoacyl-[acyl-carrier-protein] synthase-3